MTDNLPSKCTRTLKGHVGPVHVVRFDKRGEYCMSGGQDRKIYLWNPFSRDDEVLVQTYSGHSWEINDICIANDSRSFASCGGDRQVYLWDSVTGRILRQFQGHHLKINTLNFNEDSSVLASGSDDKSVRLWDVRARESRYPIQILDEARDSIGSIFVKGTSIAVGSVDGNVRIYDIRKGAMTSDNLTDAVTSVKLGTGCYLASLMNSTIQLIDSPSGKPLNTFRGHQQVKYRIESCFTADESTVVSGSEDSAIYLWDLMTGDRGVKKKLTRHGGTVVSIAAHPKINSILLSASSDGTIKLWE